MNFKKLEVSRQGNFILTLLFIHFIFFGYLCYIYEKSIGNSILFLHQVMFIPQFFDLSVYDLTINGFTLNITLFSILYTITFVVFITSICYSLYDRKIFFNEKGKKLIIISVVAMIYLAFLMYFFPIGIYVLLIFLMVFREHFFEYGIRNSIWIIPFIIFMSWVWYWFIIEVFDIILIPQYFGRIESYITIFMLVVINLITAFIAAAFKEKVKDMQKNIIEIKEN